MNKDTPVQMAEATTPDRIGRFLYRCDGDRWAWTDTLARMHGYDPRDVTPTTELLLSHNHPDDRQDHAQTLHAIRTVTGSFSSRHRIVDTKGVILSIAIVSESCVDDTGNITGSTGFYVDVTHSVDERVFKISDSRESIEQAKGMLMLVYGITADRAFEVLVRRSQLTNVKLRVVAEQLLAQAATDPHPPQSLRSHFDHLRLHL